MSLLREFPLYVDDILGGCGTLIGNEIPIEHYLPLLESALNGYFFPAFEGESELYFETKYAITSNKAMEVKQYVESELVKRIQASLKVVYPSRTYDYVYNRALGSIVVREFDPPKSYTPNGHLPANEPTNDISDDWIPERLRGK